MMATRSFAVLSVMGMPDTNIRNKMDLVIETDIGHDPDDFFAISYLIAAGVNVKAICVTPGDPDQLAIARFVADETGLDIPICASKLDREKRSSGSIHHDLLKRYGRPLDAKPDGLGRELLKGVLTEDTEVFVIGPVSSVGGFLADHPDFKICRATMQGGFAPYSIHRPQIVLEKFQGKEWVPTFNLNGDRKAGVRFLDGVKDLRMVGKNVCHTVEFNRERLNDFAPLTNRAAELFMEGAQLYFERHDAKKFHDPTAAVCHLDPGVGMWRHGKTVKRESGWTTEVMEDGGDLILVDISYDDLWDHLCNWRGNNG